MYTNGYYNQTNSDQIKFSYDKFEELLKSVRNMSMEEQGKFMEETIEDWVGDSGLNDDISLIGFRINDL